MLKFTCCDALKSFSGSKNAHVLRGIVRGFEKECLRVDTQGKLSLRPHPLALGSKLTHPWITTDYSEALLEFITPPSTDTQFPLAFLRDIHRFTARHIGDEVLWPTSMPCVIGDDNDIPIADYGTSNQGRFKYVYREGLGHRYGRHMQTIAGVHYNWSLPTAFWQALRECCLTHESDQEYINRRYFDLIRNFQRFGWLIPYLFGASPAICRSFLRGKKTDLKALSAGTLYGPYATSLRMSDLGYQNKAQASLRVNFNSVAEYTNAMEYAIRTPDPFYEQIGVEENGHWKQLNGNLLQIENEFYAGIRPKRVGQHGERPARALSRYGVEYLEVRLFDLDPFSPMGVNDDYRVFGDVLLLMCLFRDSPPISEREQGENAENKRRIVSNGRHPDLHLLMHNREHEFRHLAQELFDDMQPFAEMLDAAYGGDVYDTTMTRLRDRLYHPESTPSAIVLDKIQNAGSFCHYILAQANDYKNTLMSESLSETTQSEFIAVAQKSLDEQRTIEARDSIPFEQFVASYYQ